LLSVPTARHHLLDATRPEIRSHWSRFPTPPRVFLKRRLDELDFELTKPSTGQAYNDTMKQPKERKKNKAGITS
jgi:hypothetical protein